MAMLKYGTIKGRKGMNEMSYILGFIDLLFSISNSKLKSA